MFCKEIRTKQDLSYIPICSLSILYNSKFILMETSLGTNAAVVTRVHCSAKSSEASHLCASNEYLQHILSRRSKDNILWIPGPQVIKLFSCSTQLSMKFFMLINLRLLTIAISLVLNIADHEHFSANKYENANYCWHFYIY